MIGDILVSITGDTGMVGLIPDGIGESYINQHIAMCRPLTGTCPSYIAMAFTSPPLLNQLWGYQRGVKNSLGLDDIRVLQFPLPPLPEQHRIVAKVDALMALLDRLEVARSERETARAASRDVALAALRDAPDADTVQVGWTRIAEHMDDLFTDPADVAPLRQTILQLAVRGKLVPQDPSDEPACALLEHIAAEKGRLVKEGRIPKPKTLPLVGEDEAPFEVPKEWVWVRLGTIALNIHYGYTASANHQKRDVLLLRITDIQENTVNWLSVPGCNIDEDQVERYRLNDGDIVVARTGGTVGKTYRVTGRMGLVAVFASYLIRVKRLV